MRKPSSAAPDPVSSPVIGRPAKSALNANSDKPGSPSPPRKMKDADVEREFVELLIGMGILPTARDKMVQELSINQKWHYLEQHKAKLKDMSKGKITQTPQFFVQALQAGVEVDVLRQLGVCLSSEPLPWQEAFVAQGGPLVLLNLLTTVEKDKANDHKQVILRELIRCMLALLRNKKARSYSFCLSFVV